MKKNNNKILISIGIIGALCAVLLFMAFHQPSDEPKISETPIISDIQTTPSVTPKAPITAETLGKESKIEMVLPDGSKINADFTLGEYQNYFLYLPEGLWVKDSYGAWDTWFLANTPDVSIRIGKQMYIDVTNDLACLETDYNYQKLEGYENTMFLEEGGYTSIVQVIASKGENAVFEINYTYPTDKEHLKDMWKPIFATFESFDISLLN